MRELLEVGEVCQMCGKLFSEGHQVSVVAQQMFCVIMQRPRHLRDCSMLVPQLLEVSDGVA